MQYKCRFKIDELFLDNTYCDPIFDFPHRSKALKLLADIIQSSFSDYKYLVSHYFSSKKVSSKKKVYLCTDTIGKEEAFVLLAEKYKTPIVLNQERYIYC